MRKKRTFNKKPLCAILAISLMAASLSGCGKKNKGNESNVIEEASKSSKDYVFRAEELDIGIKTDNFRSLGLYNGRIHAVSGDTNILRFISFNPDGSDVKDFTVPETENEGHNEFAYDSEGNVYCIYYQYSYDEGDVQTYEDGEEAEGNETAEGDETTEESADDNAVNEESSGAAEENSVQNEDGDSDIISDDSDNMEDSSSDEYQYLVEYDANGNLVDKVSLAEYSTDGYFSCGGMVYLEGKGLYIFYDGGVLSYSKDEGFKSVLKTEAKEDVYMSYYTPHLGSDGKIYVTNYGDKGLELHEFDLENGKVGDAIEIPVASHNSDYYILQGNGYPLYVSDESAVYGYDIANNNMVKLLDYIDSDLQVGYALTELVAMSDTEFITLIQDEDYYYHLNRLTKVPADQVKDKKIITLGGYYVDYDIRMNAINFNKNNDEYKIKLVDYSSLNTDEDSEAGMNQFNLDIASGNVPDIMVFRSSSPVDSYINKGLFEDLTGYMEKEPDMSQGDFLPSVIDALKTNGKLYQIVPAFYVASVTTKTKYLEGKNVLTFDDCNKLIKATGASYEFAFGITDRNELLSTGLALSGDKYIDWESKSCSFNSESFINFLEFTSKFPEEYKDDAWETYKETFFRDGQSLFNMTYLSDFRGYKRYKQGLFGEDISFIGFPNDMGANCSVIYPECRIAISSKSSSKDGAWDFVKTFLTEEYQDKLGEYNFPIRQSSFDKMGEASMHKVFYMEGDEKVEYDDTYYVDDLEIVIDPLTAEEVQEVKDFIASITLVYSVNDSVNAIIQEEASAFYSGQKTAQEVADIIQSRVSIYVNENS